MFPNLNSSKRLWKFLHILFFIYRPSIPGIKLYTFICLYIRNYIQKILNQILLNISLNYKWLILRKFKSYYQSNEAGSYKKLAKRWLFSTSPGESSSHLCNECDDVILFCTFDATILYINLTEWVFLLEMWRHKTNIPYVFFP